MGKIRVSVVKYINSYPFIYGLTKELPTGSFSLMMSDPAECARHLINDDADIGLVPVASIPLLKAPVVISDYCIGASGKVKTVLLLSESPVDKLDTIWLDHRSMTSVNLVKVLAKHYWKFTPTWKETWDGFDPGSIGKNEGVVLIGDQCFNLPPMLKYRYDLAEEWIAFTGLPFVFACWVANKEIDPSFIVTFNRALARGVENITDAVASVAAPSGIPADEILDYLYTNIDYNLDLNKREGMNLFLNYLKQ